MAVMLKQSTAVSIKLGPFVDEEDGVTPETSLTISQADVRLAKNDANWAQKSASGNASHEENGWYEISLSTTDTNTLGTLIVAVNESGALPVWREFQVVPANVYDSLVASSDNLQVDTTQWGGTAVASANVLIDGAVTAAKLASNAITDAKIASGALTAAKFASGAFDAVWSVTTRLLTAGTNIVLAKGTGVTGFNDLDAAGVRTAVGLASANLDTQLGTIDNTADAIKAVTDNLPDSGALTSIAQASDLAATDGKVDDILEDTGTTLPSTLSSIEGKVDGLNDLSAAEVNAEVVDALATDTYAEPGQGAPASTTSLAAKIGYLYKAFRNKHTQTSDTYSLYNDAGDTVDQKATVSDTGTTFERSEVESGA